ncbi:alpha/beta hydrolase fold domain-containing protein [bacterium]|nr:alpha/beta hydrolase fold domain-containing protein [bacterium]
MPKRFRYLWILLLATSPAAGEEKATVTGKDLFEKVDPSIRDQIPPMLKQGLDEVVVQTDVTFAQRSSGPLKLDIYRTREAASSNTSAKPGPAILVIHGGSWKSGDRKQLGLYAASLARRGYVTYAVEYRLAPKHPWPAQWEDVRDAVLWLKKHAGKQGIDPERIGAVGYSAGGHLATMLATKGHLEADPDQPKLTAAVRCVAAGGAPCDFSQMPLDNKFLAYWLGATRKEKPEVYVQASPLQLVSASTSPIFFFNGTLDLVVRPNSAKILSDKLVTLGIDSALHLVPGAGHITAALDDKALEIAWNFLDKHLKTAADASESSRKQPRAEAGAK